MFPFVQGCLNGYVNFTHQALYLSDTNIAEPLELNITERRILIVTYAQAVYFCMFKIIVSEANFKCNI